MKKILFILIACLAIMTPVRAGALVNLNNATQAQLESVKGIGPAKARSIIDYRNKMGPFRSVDDLKKVTGFGEKTVARMRPELTVGNARPPAARIETGKSR
ncbi:MAG: helix-hairpin-helix domain-containing protein [Sulfuricella denitrificans]|nr:helix-hairpin-helix domain-containing protein [Sulfuricella denitrificans]